MSPPRRGEIYAVGDIHGRFDAFRALLDAIEFAPARDRLWLVGDIVNRGPDSLAMLRWARAHEESTTLVLGNHDLHLLTVCAGFARPRGEDALEEALAAPDRDGLCEWLRRRPLARFEPPFFLVHAGLLPQWTPAVALARAREAESAIGGARWRDFFAALYGDFPDRWSDSLPAFDRARLIVNAMTRMRVCDPDGRVRLDYKGVPHASPPPSPRRDLAPDLPPPVAASIPPGARPWFDAPGRKSRDAVVVCGHWASLGLFVRDNLLALDTNCGRGDTLTAARLSDRRIFQVAVGSGAASSASATARKNRSP